MMWIVRLAIRRPYTIGVISFFILLMGTLSIFNMNVDIFPSIDIPVVAVVWNYPGLSASEMEKKVTFLSERGISTSVNGVDRIESQTQPGIAILRIYFQKGTDIGAAIAQMTSVSAASLRGMPPGMTPPIVVQFNASNVPVAQITMSSKTLSEDKIFDYGLNFIRLKLFTIPGLSTPAPFGGKNREIVVDVDPEATQAKGLSPIDVVNALQISDIIIPAGTARIGTKEYNIALNASPDVVKQFNDIPVKVVNGQIVRLGDVAKVSDSYADQLNVVRIDRRRATYLQILKKSTASTLMVVDAAKAMIPLIKETAPKGLDLSVDFDQSVFVRNSIDNVLHEGITAAILVSLMILFFLGSWRSMVIVCTSIPLSIMVSIIGLNLTGNTLNIMTLGGLSLAIGMLVDDATVEIENIHRNRGLGRPLTIAILVGAQEIATPALMATLAICIVFFPVILLTGPSRFLFTPMALSVVIAMLASYFLSRTPVPTLARMLMENEPHHDFANESEGHVPEGGWFKRISYRFNRSRDKNFEKFRDAYGRLLHGFLMHRKTILAIALAIMVISGFLVKVVGLDFFPSTDTGMMKIHFRAPTGSRIEETEKIVDAAEADIQKLIPAKDLDKINDMIGVPVSYNLAFVPTDNAGSMDAEILISLKPGHEPTNMYADKIRADFSNDFPGCSYYFQPADIVNQVLNFGLSAPIDVQIAFANYDSSYVYAKKLKAEMETIPGTKDVNIKQVLDYPAFRFDVDRLRASQLGLSERDVSNNLLIALSSSTMVAPTFFINPQNNVNYTVAVKVPYAKLNTISSLTNMPITSSNLVSNETVGSMPMDVPTAQTQTLGNLTSMTYENQYNLINHYTVARVIDITANVQGHDLGSVSSAIQKKIDNIGRMPQGMHVVMRGQPEVMNSSFSTLGLGLILAIALVYLLMVVLFQSWLDPFIILFAVPGAFIGILWMLVITGTTINTVSLMGSIVAVGIAVSNSILLVSFANEIRIKNPRLTAMDAALEAGKTRLRPVLMTALAMVLGMIPMSIGSGAGGEQNAPLGRAVMGGLMMATIVTLLIVPLIYSIFRQSEPTMHTLDVKFAKETEGLDNALRALEPPEAEGDV